MNITEAEYSVLRSIARNEFAPNNGSEPSSYWEASTWSNTIDCNFLTDCKCPTGKALSGVVSSLVRKGLLASSGDVVEHTEEGFSTYKEIARDRGHCE